MTTTSPNPARVDLHHHIFPSGELAESLRKDGATVSIQDGRWGREVVGTATGVVRFIGVDGYRWMIRCVVNASAETVDALAVSLAHHAEAQDDRGPLVGSFRALVYSVTIHPKGPRERFQIEVKGKLTALIGGNAYPQSPQSSPQ